MQFIYFDVTEENSYISTFFYKITVVHIFLILRLSNKYFKYFLKLDMKRMYTHI